MTTKATTETAQLGVFLPTEDDPEFVSWLEELGYESVWAGEGQGRAAFGKLEHWASATDEIRLASGIVNVFSRSPATIAQEIATLDDHTGGRAVLGIGTAHPGVVRDFHGIQFENPLPRLAEYIELIRRYLLGTTGDFDGRFFSPSRTTFWDAFDRSRTVPIFNGALGPENVRLTGRLADGWVPNFYPLSRFDTAYGWLTEGATEAGRDVTNITVGMYLLVSVDEDVERARQRAASHVAFYLRKIPGYYDRPLREAGFGEEIQRVTSANDHVSAVAEISDDMLNDICVIGTPTDVRTGVGKYIDAGVDVPIIRAPTGASSETLEATVTAFSE